VYDVLPGTAPLLEASDMAATMVAAVSAYLDRALEEADRQAAAGSARPRGDRNADLAARRERLARALGVVDARLPVEALEIVSSTAAPFTVAVAGTYDVHAVRWPVLEGVEGEGLWLDPRSLPAARVIALPDADWSPEQRAGLAPGMAPEAQFARRLAELGCDVVVPTLIDRDSAWSGQPDVRESFAFLDRNLRWSPGGAAVGCPVVSRAGA
jgi:hypothetical protein